MLGMSLPEVIFLAILALVIIGPKQMPEVARTLGRMINELRRASSTLTDELRNQVKIDPIRVDDLKPADKTTTSNSSQQNDPNGNQANEVKSAANSDDAEAKKI